MTLGDVITWMSFALGLPAVAVWLWRAADLSSVWQALTERWQSRYVTMPSVGAPSDPSAAQTDGQTDQTDRLSDAPGRAPGRAELLTLYALLRAHGVPREAARAALRGVGIAIDNNLWTQAAPPQQAAEDDAIVTPYAGRRTRAAYYPDDPSLEYRAPDAMEET